MRHPITSAVVTYDENGKGKTIQIRRGSPFGRVRVHPYNFQRAFPFIWTAKIAVPLDHATVLIF